MTSQAPALSSRQRFVNPDGTPTPEFFRTLDFFVHFTGFGSITAVTVTASPFVYVAQISPGSVLVQGGTVSKVEISRDAGVTWFDTGATAGMFRILSDDQIRVTYAVAPTMTWVPG